MGDVGRFQWPPPAEGDDPPPRDCRPLATSAVGSDSGSGAERRGSDHGDGVPLLAAPRSLASLSVLGPLAETLRRIDALMSDPARTSVGVVAIPEDWAIAEARELRHTLEELHLSLLPPILNQAWPRRFTQGEERALEAARQDQSIDPALLLAGDLFRYHRQGAQDAIGQLKDNATPRPIELPFLFGEGMALGDLGPLQVGLRSLVDHA